ncbi:hypothetical protein DPMN_087479 [Dreissena polymorpha]|uniref:HMGCR/SNAP/NPC1-like sterol-sensing domain-containing protein n=2 Tax=Dreissena polymorpha TaxID=45954 RepID=A0A9D4QVM4_DREPO|nr:hypothetical protein DPMN_087479 [Dreissena polymorpha]
MIVGLAVDHIVHLAEAYQACPSPRRADRVRYMLESIGLSVLSGAATTLGAAVFMLGAQIQFFFQFGIFIITIIGLALVFSMLGFTALLSLCGPEGNTGYIPAMCKWLVKKCARKNPTNQRDPDENKKPSNPNALPGIAI